MESVDFVEADPAALELGDDVFKVREGGREGGREGRMEERSERRRKRRK